MESGDSFRDAWEILDGAAYPLGATVLAEGVTNFAVSSSSAEAVDLVLFDPESPEREMARVRMGNRTGNIWHVAVRGIGPGQVYGYRVHGPWRPEWGVFANAHKLLLDPYARRVLGASRAHPSMWDFPKRERRDRIDSGAHAPKGVVVAGDFDWGDDRLPRISHDDLIVCEMHLKGFTRLMPGVPEEIRGTYAGLGHEASISYLKGMGITAVQLLPIHHHLDDIFLLERGLVNYWGYNTIGFFAPETRYSATGDPVTEFKAMVKSLHAAGLEVILDVVYNHTGEAALGGPVCLFRGFDNQHWYRTRQKRPGEYKDVTGCGNSVDLTHPQVLQLVTDSLRYWAQEMHVDGFRFDLGVTLGRDPDQFDPRAAFFKTIQQDPVLSRLRLIAEPWDLGWGGYQVGNFPVGWSELNGKFRDCVRRFWMGDGRVVGEFAARITGSEDLFLRSGRSPTASVNFVTSHDGFSLQDLVSYSDKHNEVNGEKNLDGETHNLSENHGVEGPSDDPKIVRIRARQCRNFFATLILSQGVPFFPAGDEMGRTQRGNNNAYCQDNEISWLDWERGAAFEDLRRFVAELIRFRRRHAVLRKRTFFSGRKIHGSRVADMAWFAPDGRPVDEKFWSTDRPGTFSVVINKNSADLRHNGWRKHPSDSLMMIFNAGDKPVDFVLPGGGDVVWECRIDTGVESGFLEPDVRVRSHRGTVALRRRSMQVWRLKSGEFTRTQEFPEPAEVAVEPPPAPRPADSTLFGLGLNPVESPAPLG